MSASSTTLPRNREALRIRQEAQAYDQDENPSFARIARAMQPKDTTPEAHAAILTALGSIFGFASAWLISRSVENWYLYAALGMTAGALIGTVLARVVGKGN